MTDDAPIIKRVDDQTTSLVGGDRLRRTDGQLTDQPVAEHSADADNHVLAVRSNATNVIEKASAFNASKCATCGFWHVTDCPACCLKQPMARCICKDPNQQRHPKKVLQEAITALSERIEKEPEAEFTQEESLQTLAAVRSLQAQNSALRKEIQALSMGLQDMTNQATGFELQMQDILKKFRAVQRRDAVSDQTFNAVQKELQAARADLVAHKRERDDLIQAAVLPWEGLLKEAKARIVDLEGKLEAVGRNMRMAQDDAEALRTQNKILREANERSRQG